MNCWILLLLLFCNGNRDRNFCDMDDCFENRFREERFTRENCRQQSVRTDTCRSVCQVESNADEKDCDCNANRRESRFESRPYMNFSTNCGCEEERKNDCGCGQ